MSKGHTSGADRILCIHCCAPSSNSSLLSLSSGILSGISGKDGDPLAGLGPINKLDVDRQKSKVELPPEGSRYLSVPVCQERALVLLLLQKKIWSV